MHLDTIADIDSTVGYGQLGRLGHLGYEDRPVTVCGRRFSHALSAHAPSRLRIPLDGRFKVFSTGAALTDEVPEGVTWADFLVRVDGRLAAAVNHVRRGEPARPIAVSVGGARELLLEVETSRWEHCHSVWLEPVLQEEGVASGGQTIVDPLRRAEIDVVTPLPRAECCVATVVSAGFEGLLGQMLASLARHGGCPDALVVVFTVDGGAECERIAQAYGAHLVRCHRRAAINSMIKSVLYSVARVIDARKFLCLDADMLVLGGLDPVWSALEVAPQGSLLACREANGHGLRNLDHAIHAVYGGRPEDIHRIANGARGEGRFELTVNDGLFAGDRTGLLALDGLLRQWTGAPGWIDERRDIWWRNQFIFNLAIARLQCGVELDPVFNIQLNSQEVEWGETPGRGPEARWNGHPVRVLHFNGNGRQKYLDWRMRCFQENRIPNGIGLPIGEPARPAV